MEYGGLSVAMTGGMKTLQWPVDSWARGEEAHTGTHTPQTRITALLLPFTYIF